MNKFIYVLSLFLLTSNELMIRNLSPFDNTFTLTESTSGRFLIDVCFGTPAQCFKLKISTSNNLSWIGDKSVIQGGFDSSKSSSFIERHINETLQEKATFVKGVLVEDTIKIGDYRINNFPFILSMTDEDLYEEYIGALSLGYRYHQPEYSLLANLFEEDFIQEESFYITYDKKKKNGSFIFGSLPDDEKNYIRTKSYKMKKCSLLPYKNEIDLNNRWECALKGIYFHIPSQDAPVYLLIDDRVSFNLSSNIFLVTKKMFDIFTYVFLGKYIDKEICRIVTHGYFNLIECDLSLNLNELGSINYIIGKYSVKFKGEDLFKIDGSVYKSIIAKHTTLDTFIFGYDFFTKFNVFFNRKNDYIGWILKDNN